MSLWSALMGDGTFSLAVKGVSSCQPELEELCGGRPEEDDSHIVLAVLIPEDSNPYYTEAVRVQIRNRMVGYLAREDARALRAQLGQEVQHTSRFRCRAKIQRSWAHYGGEKIQWGVSLDVCLSTVVSLLNLLPSSLLFGAQLAI